MQAPAPCSRTWENHPCTRLGNACANPNRNPAESLSKHIIVQCASPQALEMAPGGRHAGKRDTPQNGVGKRLTPLPEWSIDQCPKPHKSGPPNICGVPGAFALPCGVRRPTDRRKLGFQPILSSRLATHHPTGMGHPVPCQPRPPFLGTPSEEPLKPNLRMIPGRASPGVRVCVCVPPHQPSFLNLFRPIALRNMRLAVAPTMRVVVSFQSHPQLPEGQCK